LSNQKGDNWFFFFLYVYLICRACELLLIKNGSRKKWIQFLESWYWMNSFVMVVIFYLIAFTHFRVLHFIVAFVGWVIWCHLPCLEFALYKGSNICICYLLYILLCWLFLFFFLRILITLLLFCRRWIMMISKKKCKKKRFRCLRFYNRIYILKMLVWWWMHIRIYI
jgi:hypothetical protein